MMAKLEQQTKKDSQMSGEQQFMHTDIREQFTKNVFPFRSFLYAFSTLHAWKYIWARVSGILMTVNKI